jgi:competence protein ComFC
VKSHQNICPNCKNPKKSSFCKKCKNLPPIYVAGSRNSLLGEIIHDYKYHSVRSLSRPLAEILDRTLPKNLPKNSILVPLPTASHHIRSRGFDHTYKIAKDLAKIRKFKIEKILLRDKNTVQVGADKKTRLKQASKAYILNQKIKINPETIYILLDDIYTTGASITAAKELLKSGGAKNIKIALLAYSS